MTNKKVTIYIDESGIHKQIDHSTIVLVYVLFNDIEKIEKQILKIEKQLQIKPFHWKEQRWKIKRAFLSEIAKLSFQIKVVILKNPINLSIEMENSFTYFMIEKKIEKIIIDGDKPRWYELKIKKVLRNKGISVKKLRCVKDISFPALRLADALAGLIRIYFDKPEKENRKFYKLFKNKITAQIMSGQTTS